MLEHQPSGDSRSFTCFDGTNTSNTPTKVEEVFEQGSGKVAHKVTVYAKEVDVGYPPKKETKYFVRYARGRGTAFSKYVHEELTPDEVPRGDCRAATFARTFDKYDVPGMSKPMDIVVCCAQGRIDLRIVDPEDGAPKVGGGSLSVAEYAEKKHKIVVPREGEPQEVPQVVADLIRPEDGAAESPAIEKRLAKQESSETDRRPLDRFGPAGMINKWEGHGVVGDSESPKRVGKVAFHAQYGVPRGGEKGGAGMDYRWVALERGKRGGPTLSYLIGCVHNDGAMRQEVELEDKTVVALSISPTGIFHFSEIYTSDARWKSRQEAEERKQAADQRLLREQMPSMFRGSYEDRIGLRREEDTLRTSQWNDPFGFIFRQFEDMARKGIIEHRPTILPPSSPNIGETINRYGESRSAGRNAFSGNPQPEIDATSFEIGTYENYPPISSGECEFHPFSGLSLLSHNRISFGLLYWRNFQGGLEFLGEVRGDRVEYYETSVALGGRLHNIRGDRESPRFDQNELTMHNDVVAQQLNLKPKFQSAKILQEYNPLSDIEETLGTRYETGYYAVQLVHRKQYDVYRYTRVLVEDRVREICYEVAAMDDTQNLSTIVVFPCGDRFRLSATSGRINEFSLIEEERRRW